MKKLVFAFTLLFFSCFVFSQDWSFRPGELWPDDKSVHINAHGGGIFFQGGKYYWFGEHKVEGRSGNRAMVGVHCYSSTNLYHWKDEGIALKVSEDSTSDIVKGCILERPKVLYNAKTKKYVMWFHLELRGKGYSAARAGLAISDHAAGPYTFVKSYRPNAGRLPYHNAASDDKDRVNCNAPATKSDSFFCRDLPGGQMSRDMTLFVDDDQKAYHIFASEENYTLHLAELTDDYTAHTGRFIRIYIGKQTEAPALFKRKGKYYLVGSGCTGWDPNPARWFIADSLWGDWKYMGNPCIGKDANITFGGQSTYILPVAGKKDAFIFMADKWRPGNAIDGRYLWLPIQFDGERMIIGWKDNWDLSFFDTAPRP